MLLYILRVYILIPMVFFVGSTLVLILFLLGFGRKDRAYFYTRFLMPFMQKIAGVKIICRNWDVLTRDPPLVIVGNHQHNYDLFIQGAFIPHHTITIGKKSLKWVPIFGWIFAMSKCIFITRGRHEQAMDAMKKAASQLNLSKLSIWMFPEGTRSGNRGILPFKRGAFYLAVTAQRPVVPVVSSSLHLGLNLKRWHAGTVIIEAMEAVSTQGLGDQDVPVLTQAVHDRMKEKFTQLNAEVLNLQRQKEALNV